MNASPADPGRLCPPPRSVARGQVGLDLRGGVRFRVETPGAEPAVAVLRDWLERRGVVDGSGASVTYGETRDPALGEEGYQLRLDPTGILIRAATPRGLFYGTWTLIDWLELHTPGEAIGGLEVEDSPDLALRGVMLDVSRDKVPTPESLRWLVDRLARLRINQLQLYMEHTFAYQGHEEVWRDASPFTPEEIRDLDAYCRARFIELVPCQNSLGHFHRWLVHDRYRPLAECPEGRVSPFTPGGEPFSLCPADPGSLALLDDLYDQLLPNFQSSWFNVGLDETWDLGLGRSAELVRERGVSRVYLDFLLAVHARAARRGRRIQYWGDIVLEHPELISELPRDALALQWGYEAAHPFGADGERFARAGLDYACCPGTSSWNSIGGRVRNALLNLREAALQARRLGARGLLITDWGDHGHWQPLPVSFIPFAAGAGCAWNSAATARLIEAEGCDGRVAGVVLDWTRRVFLGQDADGLAEVLFDLGDTESRTGVHNRNGTLACRTLQHAGRPWPPPDCEGIDRHRLDAARAWIGQLATDARSHRSTGIEARQVLDEVGWAAALIGVALEAARGLAEMGAGADWPGLPRPLREHLSDELLHLEREFAGIWHPRNRPGGFVDSRGRLSRVRRLCDGA